MRKGFGGLIYNIDENKHKLEATRLSENRTESSYGRCCSIRSGRRLQRYTEGRFANSH